MGDTRVSRRRLAAFLLVAVALSALVLVAGCSAEPIKPAEGEMSCIDCHTDREALQASLEADPLPEKEVAESEGEG
ncbi:MAG: hypothetical protein Kow0067_00030 [Coriobacteriia bacterium]